MKNYQFLIGFACAAFFLFAPLFSAGLPFYILSANKAFEVQTGTGNREQPEEKDGYQHGGEKKHNHKHQDLLQAEVPPEYDPKNSPAEIKHGGSSLGREKEKKAILATRKKDSAFQLSHKAIKLLNIQTAPARFIKGLLQVSSSSIVKFQEHTAVYVRRNGWFQLIKVKVISRLGHHFYISAQGIKANENIVISGVPLLHVAHLEALEQTGQGQPH